MFESVPLHFFLVVSECQILILFQLVWVVFFFLLSCSAGDWMRGPVHVRQASYHWTTLPAPLNWFLHKTRNFDEVLIFSLFWLCLELCWNLLVHGHSIAPWLMCVSVYMALWKSHHVRSCRVSSCMHCYGFRFFFSRPLNDIILFWRGLNVFAVIWDSWVWCDYFGAVFRNLFFFLDLLFIIYVCVSAHVEVGEIGSLKIEVVSACELPRGR